MDSICINENLIEEIEFARELNKMLYTGYADACNYFITLCFFMTFVPFVLLSSSYIVAVYVWKPYMEKTENQKVDWPFEKDEEFVPYEDKYPLVDSSGCITQEELDEKRKTSNCWVAENTPQGYVVLTYDLTYDSFTYWSNKQDIKYVYLETVARKYVQTIDDNELYICRHKDMEMQKKKLQEEKEALEKKEKEALENPDKTPKEDDVFVKLKTPMEKRKTNVKMTDKVTYAINGNKYKWMGKIDFNEMFKVKEEEKKEETNLSFSSFKKMFSS